MAITSTIKQVVTAIVIAQAYRDYSQNAKWVEVLLVLIHSARANGKCKPIQLLLKRIINAFPVFRTLSHPCDYHIITIHNLFLNMIRFSIAMIVLRVHIYQEPLPIFRITRFFVNSHRVTC